ncbi:MAG: hypothetical protein HQ596_04275 [Candidatus Saganbacteria bacterium]|nr:hypothetical protein [Candidatus Saganbacteria bacterium]
MLIRGGPSLGGLASRARAKFSRLHWSVTIQHQQVARKLFNANVTSSFPRMVRETNLRGAKNSFIFGSKAKEIFRRLLPKGAMLNFKMVPEAAETDAEMVAEAVAEMALEAGEAVAVQTEVEAAPETGAEVETKIDDSVPHVDHRSEDGVVHISMRAPVGTGHVRLEFDLSLIFFTQGPSDTGTQTIDAIGQALFEALQTAAKDWE